MIVANRKIAGIQKSVKSIPAGAEDFPQLAHMKPPLYGTENLRRLVKAYASKGVDHIKVLATERAALVNTDPRKRTFTDEELIAVVDEARNAGLRWRHMLMVTKVRMPR